MATLKQRIKYSHPFVFRLLNNTFPDQVQIQTTSVCNSDCSFCPYPVVSKEVDMGKMPTDKVHRMIQECYDLGVRSFLPFLMNEPLIDPRMPEFIETIMKLPGATTNVASNASVLTEELGRKIMSAGLNHLVINMPSIIKEEFEKTITKLDFDEVKANVDALSRYASEYKTDVEIQVNVFPDYDRAVAEKTVKHWQSKNVRVLVRVVGDRAGNVGNFTKTYKPYRKLHACRTFREIGMMHILFNGDVILCCQDWRRNIVLGNAFKTSVRDVYNSDAYFEVRRQIYGLSEAPENMLCRKCEFAIGEV